MLTRNILNKGVMGMTVKRIKYAWVLVAAGVLACAAAVPVVAKATIAHAHTPISSPSQVRPRPAPGVAPRNTYAMSQSEAWTLAEGYFGLGGLWNTHQVTSLVSVQSTAGNALSLLDPLRIDFAPADSKVWVFEAVGRFQEFTTVVANPPAFGASWVLVVQGTPGVLTGTSKTAISLDSLGSVTQMPLSDLAQS